MAAATTTAAEGQRRRTLSQRDLRKAQAAAGALWRGQGHARRPLPSPRSVFRPRHPTIPSPLTAFVSNSYSFAVFSGDRDDRVAVDAATPLLSHARTLSVRSFRKRLPECLETAPFWRLTRACERPLYATEPTALATLGRKGIPTFHPQD